MKLKEERECGGCEWNVELRNQTTQRQRTDPRETELDTLSLSHTFTHTGHILHFSFNDTPLGFVSGFCNSIFDMHAF